MGRGLLFFLDLGTCRVLLKQRSATHFQKLNQPDTLRLSVPWQSLLYPNLAKEYTMTGASQRAHAQVSVPEPPKCFGTFVGNWKGPSSDWCSKIFCATAATSGLSLVSPRSAMKDSLWKGWLALLWLFRTSPGQSFNSCSNG